MRRVTGWCEAGTRGTEVLDERRRKKTGNRRDVQKGESHACAAPVSGRLGKDGEPTRAPVRRVGDTSRRGL